MKTQHLAAAPQRGFALMTSILLLFIITILALSMFRGFATQEHIAGNLREKERALHAAVSAEQYAEWWLLQGTNGSVGTAVDCAAGTIVNGNVGGGGPVCTLALTSYGYTVNNPSTWGIYTYYTPPGLSVSSALNGYFALPAYYILDVGKAGDGLGEAYQIDAYGYGGSAATVAVVESTYEVQQGVTCLSCPTF
ncbi:MAG TPA: PilX N-terminal domain-containing pilus assembly protein [Steroidobacteraceae bacterium]|jgi:type IV pilus assembly protein PilX